MQTEMNCTNRLDNISTSVREHIADSDAPAVYCGTYHKYNNGSLFGEWLDLDTFVSCDEFIEVCRALHNDEEDPELMFQDFQNFPETFFNKGFFGEEEFDKVQEYIGLDYDEQRQFEAFMEAFGNDSIDDFRDRFCGEYDSEEDYARECFYECCPKVYGDDASDFLERYFDYERFASDLFSGDYTFQDGCVFRDY